MQVYKARLRRGGELVAVKVQRPGIVEQISLDFFLVRGACQFVDKYVDAVTTPLVPLLDEFASRVYQELNYVQVSTRMCPGGRCGHQIESLMNIPTVA